MEDLRIVPIVESPLQFLQVSVQMFDADLVERTDDGPLEQAPNALNAVCVNITDNPLLGRVPDSFMAGVLIPNPDIGLQFVCVNRLSFILNGSMDEIMESMTLDIGDAFDSDLSAVPLDGTNHPGFTFLAPRSDVSFLPTDQGFVHFDDAKQSWPFKGIVTHGLSDSVTEIPGGVFRSDSQRGFKLAGGDPFLGYAHREETPFLATHMR